MNEHIEAAIDEALDKREKSELEVENNFQKGAILGLEKHLREERRIVFFLAIYCTFILGLLWGVAISLEGSETRIRVIHV